MAKDKTKKRKKKNEATPSTLPQVVEHKSDSLVPSDPLTAYLEMVRSHPELTESEVRSLSMRVHQNKDKEAAIKLVTSHLRLVVKIAFQYRNQFQNMLDLIQEGNIGLMRAVEKFDPFKGVPLPAYATYWIKANMIKYILDNWRLVRVGTTNTRRKLLYNLTKVTEELKSAGMQAGTKQLAQHFNASESDVVAVQKSLSAGDLSIDAPLSDESQRSYAEVLSDEKPAMDEELGAKQITALVKKYTAEFAKDLNDSKKSILYDRLMNDEPKTLVEIGDMYGVSREAIRQSEVQLKKRLAEYLQKKIPGISGFQFTK